MPWMIWTLPMLDGISTGSLVAFAVVKGTRRGAWWSMWALQRSQTGIQGDPTLADIETGRLIAEAAILNLAKILRDYWRA